MTQEVALAVARLSALLEDKPDPARVLGFVFEGVPVAKERARWSPKSQTWYTPGKTANAEEALAWAFKAALGARKPFAGTVAIIASFFVPTRQRRDVDNCMKLVMDAATKASIWKDDSQVVLQLASIALDAGDPRTVIAVAPCASSLSRAPLLESTGAI